MVATESSVGQAFELFSAAAPEGWRVELVEGEICLSPPGNGAHAEIVSELAGQVIDRRGDPSLRAYTGVGLKVPTVPGIPGVPGADYVLPDLTVAPRSSFANEDVWQYPSDVLLAAEVTSAGTAERDRGKKLCGYARAGIPVYLLIDGEKGEVVVHFEPSDGAYGCSVRYKWGLAVPLPAPLGFELDTAEF
ncbi:Uma2 family endonuclease [Streptomyces sp. SID12488]|uniref:Uma2 family endonuclease n=1 Tax=Streptomyces sp. SID12488 TaxID=2706040 RepID=UPI001EF2E1D5|nr:Uma2 family endonuclease [Streptomyces sp. SID12488]